MALAKLQKPSASRPTNVRWLIFGLSCATSWLLYLHRYSWGLVKSDIQQEYGFTKEQMGWLDSVFSFGYAAFQVPGGLAGDLVGPGMVLVLVIVAWSLTCGSIGLGGGLWSFAGIRLTFGITQAPTYPNLGKVSKSWFPFSIRTTLQGAVASFSGRMGGACASLIVATLLMGVMGLSWRSALWTIGGVGVAYAVIVALLFRSRPEQHPWVNQAEEQLIAEGEPPVKPNVKPVYHFRPLVLLSFFFLLLHIFTSAFADQVFVNWIPQFLEEEKGMSKEELGFSSLPLFGGAIGGLFAGFLNDRLIRRFGGPRWARTLVGGAGKIIAGGLILVSLGVGDPRAMMLVVAVAKFFTDWSQPTVWGAVTDIGGPATGRIFGIVNMSGSIGGIVAGPIWGRIIGDDGQGWTNLFITVAAIYLVSGLSWLFINTSRPLVSQK